MSQSWKFIALSASLGPRYFSLAVLTMGRWLELSKPLFSSRTVTRPSLQWSGVCGDPRVGGGRAVRPWAHFSSAPPLLLPRSSSKGLAPRALCTSRPGSLLLLFYCFLRFFFP